MRTKGISSPGDFGGEKWEKNRIYERTVYCHMCFEFWGPLVDWYLNRTTVKWATLQGGNLVRCYFVSSLQTGNFAMLARFVVHFGRRKISHHAVAWVAVPHSNVLSLLHCPSCEAANHPSLLICLFISFFLFPIYTLGSILRALISNVTITN